MGQPGGEIEAVSDLLASGFFNGIEARHILARARARALGALDADEPDARCAAVALLLAESLTPLWLDREWQRDALDELIARAADLARVSPGALRTSVAMLVLRDSRLLELPSALAVETQLHRVVALAPLEGASLWAIDSDGDPELLCEAGDHARPAAAVSMARAVLELGPFPAPMPDRIVAEPVMRWQRPAAALVAVAADGAEHGARFLLEEAATALGPALERQAILRRNTGREQALTEASERSLERLGLDLHDGPIQDLAALAADLRLYERQLRSELSSHAHSQVLLGRVDDLQARLRELHGDLRGLSENLAAPRVLQRSLRPLLEAEAAAFRERTDVDLALEMRGDLAAVSPAQRVALLRVTQEALNNVRDHAGASRASIAVVAEGSELLLTVTDDGRGFVVEDTVADAARRGRLGLVGMSERMRLLGGACSVDSRPGGPTRVAVVLPICATPQRQPEGRLGPVVAPAQ